MTEFAQWGWWWLEALSLVGVVAAWHALLHKREPRAAFAWMLVTLTLPLLGAALYLLFGINRAQRRARRLRGGPWQMACPPPASLPDVCSVAPDTLADLARAGGKVTGLPLWPGNALEIFHDGDQVYPAMLAAIRAAHTTIDLATYIFENNALGRDFVAALAEAGARGVRVRVLLDGLGEWYSRGIRGRLRGAGIAVRRFNPPRLLPPSLNINLRNHRKLLLVDGRIAFTGGINIGDRHLLDPPRIRHPVADLHFALRGPVLVDLHAVFQDSWIQADGDATATTATATTATATGDTFATPPPVGDSLCRVIPDGPDEHMDLLALMLHAATAAARSSLRIMTPYFLPSRELIAALQSAALRGIAVTVLLPGHSNLPYVHWATRHLLADLLRRGVRVCYQPPPFHHGKLLIVDDAYVLLGSANIDPRSLRLNYELGVEVFDARFAQELARWFDGRVAVSTPLALAALEARSLAVRTRDALCWLASPYL
ncbi:MAG TPA: phospholipase D-like domain-containing protein [Porticoccaceae bacterium]|nr:phospholipase D-like domain-containing protein [Porticoccaceae bacterium]